MFWTLLCGLSFSLAAEFPKVTDPPDLGMNSKNDAALIIGNEDYASLPRSPDSVRDAEAITTLLTTTRGVRSNRVTTLTNASADDIKKEMYRAAKKASRGTLWVYYSGHGVGVGEARMLLGAAAEVNEAGAAGDMVALDELEAIAGKNRTPQVVFILDAGWSGVGRDGTELAPGVRFPIAPEPIPTYTKIAVWSASSDHGNAEHLPQVGHGLFTWTVLGGLRGWADGADGSPADGVITLGEAQDYSYATIRTLGYDRLPTVSFRGDRRDWTLVQGRVEQGPDAETYTAIRQDDLSRRIAALTAQARAEAGSRFLAAKQAAMDDPIMGEQGLRQFLDDWSGATLDLRIPVVVPEVVETQEMLRNYGDLVARALSAPSKPASGGDAPERIAPPPPPPPPPPSRPAGPKVDDSCDNLMRLEPLAMMGRFTDGQIICMERKLNEASQTDKDKMSRMLIANAEGKKDFGEVERLIRRHLDEINRSDPDITYKYARMLFSSDPINRGNEVVKWADYSLENKSQWREGVFERRVYALYQLKSEAALRLWQVADAEYIKTRTPEAEEGAERARGTAKQYAREWLDYARASGQDESRAYELCLSAAGAPGFCEE